MRELVVRTFNEWKQEDITRMGAALAYFAAFSVIPLALLIAALAGMIFGQEQVESEMVRYVRDLVGAEIAQLIREVLQTFYADQGTNRLTTVFSALALLLGATGLFRHLKSALNVIWNVPPAHQDKMRGFIHDTVLSAFTVVVVSVGMLLLFLANGVLFVLLRSLNRFMPNSDYIYLWQLFGAILLFFTTMALFAAIYKALPDAHVSWRDVWVGAGVSTLLFMGGQYVLALFLSNSTMDTLYGAASAFMLILIWVYVSAHIVLLGAEFTQVYANLHGSKIVPTSKETQSQSA